MKKYISVYVKGDRNSSSYYRFYQYFDLLNGVDVRYRIMYPKWVETRFSPVGQQPFIIKVLVYIVAYFRMLISLIEDAIQKPDSIVVSRRIINKFMPTHFKWFFSYILSKGAFFIWDYDDHILEGKEITKKDFVFFAKKANCIFVTHEYLKNLVPHKFIDKVHLLPTTDGDMYKEGKSQLIHDERLRSFNNQLNLVWVAYSINLEHLRTVIPALDKAASQIKNKHVVLHVVCDKPLEETTENLIVNNIKWEKNIAIDTMRKAHIGIMPLKPSEYSKGKGGFKLVQYISIGLPCIASNVGYNRAVIGDNECGILVDSPEGWCDAVLRFSDLVVWNEYSSQAYNRWNKYFSFENNLRIWENVLDSHKIE